MNERRICAIILVGLAWVRGAFALPASISAGAGPGTPGALVATRDDGGRIGLWDSKGASVPGWPVAAYRAFVN